MTKRNPWNISKKLLYHICNQLCCSAVDQAEDHPDEAQGLKCYCVPIPFVYYLNNSALNSFIFPPIIFSDGAKNNEDDRP